jgi:hypothetical protein
MFPLLWVITEFPKVLVAVHIAMSPAVPLPPGVVSGDASGFAEPAAATARDDVTEAPPGPPLAVPAKANADAGSPPRVSASTAFSE